MGTTMTKRVYCKRLKRETALTDLCPHFRWKGSNIIKDGEANCQSCEYVVRNS